MIRDYIIITFGDKNFKKKKKDKKKVCRLYRVYTISIKEIGKRWALQNSNIK